ncbi:MAG: hypothetical protein Q9191_005190 [Dirinaria sp. TL-2023a]
MSLLKGSYRFLPLDWLQFLVQAAKDKSAYFVKVLQDFGSARDADQPERSRQYYQPFLRREPYLVRSVEDIQELCEASELSQAAVYGDIFGFQYTMGHNNVDWDPIQQINIRHRLPTRAIKVKGLPQIEALQPYLKEKLDDIIAQKLESQISSDTDGLSDMF